MTETATAEVRVDPARRRGAIDPAVYGQFLENIGRAVYGGVYEPGSPLADADGYRTDVVAACRELGPTVLRWPGGNFASGYHWRDGIGPAAERPTRRDLAWNAIESNAFGTEEFLALCRRLGAEPYLNLNLSTGTFDEALGWLEYCNATEPLPEAQLRRQGPHPQPHDVRVWGLGNENYGWWQHGHTSAESYGETARELAKLLRWADQRVQLVAVGAPDPDWNWTVLRQVSRFADYLSLHCYWHGDGDDRYAATLAGPAISEAEIVATHGMACAAARAQGVRRPLRIAVDEWGVWSRTNQPLNAPTDVNELMRQGLNDRSGIDVRFEEAFDLGDALAVATWLHVLWRHPEKVGLATQAQMVNVIAPVHTTPDGVLRHTVFHPLAIARACAGSSALDVHVTTSDEVAAPGTPEGALPVLDAAGTIDPGSGGVHLSLVNRARDREVAVRVLGVGGRARVVRLWHEDVEATNTADAPARVAPVEDQADLHEVLVLPPHSHVTVRTG